MNTQKMQLVGLALAVGLSGSAQATLMDRGGGLIYDTDLNVTWMQDANYAQTSGYITNGHMTWDEANTWATNLDYGGYTDWRLPTTNNASTPCTNTYTYSGGTCGFNNPGTSELSHLFYIELGNLAWISPTGQIQSNSGLVNKGPFINFYENNYWSGTDYVLDPSNAWTFYTTDGGQFEGNKIEAYGYALAVRNGDVAAVPEPEAWGLMLSGLGLVGWAARRRQANNK